MSQSPAEIAKNWFEVVWNQGRRDAIAQMMAPNVLFHDANVDTQGIVPFQQFFDRMHAVLSNIHIDVDDTLVDGEKVCLRWRAIANHTGDGLGIPPTGKEVRITGISVVRVVDGIFVEAWQNWDMMGMMEQIKSHSQSLPAQSELRIGPG